MFGPWIEVFAWLKGLLPRLGDIGKPHLNFITLHYIYLISLAIITSIIIYPVGNLAYIDALFFSAGAATQSGLNTVNVNDLYTYQQVVLMLIACIGNPIFINTFVVFVRLYWFEKRFQNIVLEAHKFRRTRERSRTKTEARRDPELGRAGHRAGNNRTNAQNNRHIRVGEETISRAERMMAEPSEDARKGSSTSENEASDRKSNDANGTAFVGQSNFKTNRDIAFADEPNVQQRRNSEIERVPVQRSADQHIAFLEKQRNPTDKSVLYIPGPRDFDRGQGPEEVHSSPVQDRSMRRQNTLEQLSNRDQRQNSDQSDSQSPQKNRRVSLENAAAAIVRAKKVMSKMRMPPAGEGNKDDFKDNEKHGIRQQGRASTFKSFKSFMSGTSQDFDPIPYLSYQPTIGRNSAFVNLTEDQREELGGIEYRALKTLAAVLVCYFVGFHLLGAISLVPWILRSGRWGPIVESDGVSRVWWGFFTSTSMFNDLGFTLTPDSMISFQFAVWPLLIGSFLIIIGNTGFPCMLRLVIWILSKFIPRYTSLYEELRFLLDHPRRCFTLLFPSGATWWLFWVLVLLNGVDLLFFAILDLKDPVVTVLPPGIRILCGWFQAASTRTAGFADVNLAELHPGIQVSYLIMMYISVFPIAISVRRTNVYEERSLGIYAGQEEDEKGRNFVGAHLRRQLSFDLWYVFLGFFIIAIVEGDRLQNTNQYAFTMFSVLFEVVSAYGTVGLSLGYPGIDASFSAEFKTLSKLIIIAMQIRGRHRGLPYALDKAILLPSEGLQKKEAEEVARRARKFSAQSGMGENRTMNHETQDLQKGADQEQKSKRNGIGRLISQALGAGPMNKLNKD